MENQNALIRYRFSPQFQNFSQFYVTINYYSFVEYCNQFYVLEDLNNYDICDELTLL